MQEFNSRGVSEFDEIETEIHNRGLGVPLEPMERSNGIRYPRVPSRSGGNRLALLR